MSLFRRARWNRSFLLARFGFLSWVLLVGARAFASTDGGLSTPTELDPLPSPKQKGKAANLSPGTASKPASHAVTLPEVDVTATSEWTSPELTSGEPNAPILPTAAPVISTYGVPTDVMDTPRQITPVNQTLLKAAGTLYQGYIDPISLSSILPTAYTQINGGMNDSITIRGRQALPYINGIELTLQNNAQAMVPWSWNMVESMDIQEGPANAVFGATQASTGSVNYITKQPYFDQFRGRVWDTTGMYDQYLWGADAGGPVNDKVAWRFSYMGQDQGSYYQYMYNRQENFYVAVGAKPYENYKIDFYGDYGSYDFYPQFVDMMNRPTNALIRNGLYNTGVVPGFPATVAQGGPITGSPTNPAYSTYAGSVVPINRRATLWSPYGGGQGTTGLAQLVQNLTVSEDLAIVNNTMFWYSGAQFVEPQVYYSEYVPGDYEIDNRTEVRWSYNPLAGESEHRSSQREQDLLETAFGSLRLHNVIDTGLEWHYQHNEDYLSQNVMNYSNSWSIANPAAPGLTNPALFYLPSTKQFRSYINNPHASGGGEWHIPGAPAGYYYEPLNGAGGTTFGHYWAVAPFFQNNLDITDKLSLYFGVRATGYFWDYSTPAGPAGMPQIPSLTSASLQQSSLNPLLEISPVYKPFPWMTTYFTYNWSYVTNAAAFGGAAPTFDAASFRLLNQLIEGGLKFNLLEDKLFVTAAGFSQNQALNNISLPATLAQINGYEVNIAYQPNRNWWARLGYIYMHGVENWSSLPHGPSMAQNYSTAIALQEGLALNTSSVFPSGIYNMIGFPDQYASGTITYTSDAGIGVTLQGIAMSRQYLDYFYDTYIPSQFLMNLQVFYTQPKWELRLYIYNLGNQNYWLPFGVGSSGTRTFDEENIVAGWPFWIEGTAIWKF
ncbi:MAG: TonB-dependent receptor [Methylacidiphilaceae bacterium]|nr:TonB-dependent receptor [Candidatus Methylacidiphilaceae bacterium]